MTHKDIREIFSMLANICFPTIINVITKDIIQFLNQIELVVDGKEFGYLINLLETNDFSSLEKKHDEFNVKLVEFTFSLYQVWMEYIEDYVGSDFDFNFHLHKSYIEKVSDDFFTCILNDKIMHQYANLESLEEYKQKIINADIIEKYKDNVISGYIKCDESLISRVNQTFKIVREHFIEIDADKVLFVYINLYEEYCRLLIKFIDDFKENIASCKEDYLKMCESVFEKHLNELYEKLIEYSIEFDIICLKLHILDFIKNIIG